LYQPLISKSSCLVKANPEKGQEKALKKEIEKMKGLDSHSVGA
jgi:hypothetical protein